MSNYPQSWLNTNGCNFIWTNQEILEMSEEERLSNQFIRDWFNPFEEPQKLVEQRQIYNPKEWREYVKYNYPGINVKKQYEERLSEVKIERAAKCGMKITKVDTRSGEIKERTEWCHIYDLCPNCAKQKRKELAKELENNAGVKLVYCKTEEEAREYTKKYGTENYKRYAREDGTIALTIRTQDQIGEYLTYEKIEDLANSVQLTGKRTSGKLCIGGKKEEEEPEPEKPEMVFDFDNVNPATLEEYEEGDVFYREMEIEYNEAIKTVQELMEKVQERVILDQHPETIAQLQYSIYTMEKCIENICLEYGLEFNFYIKKKDRVDIKYVDWKWLKEKLKKV